MGDDFDFIFGNDFGVQDFDYGNQQQQKGGGGGKGKIILFLLILLGAFFAYKNGLFNNLLAHHSTQNSTPNTNINIQNNSNNNVQQTQLYSGYYTNNYIVSVDMLNTVTINGDNYYMLKLKLFDNQMEQLNIINPTKEVEFYNTALKKNVIRLTVPVSKELLLTLPFRPLLSFSREYVPVMIYSNTEDAYDYFLIKTDVMRNSPLPPNTRGAINLIVSPVTNAVLVNKHTILAKFKMSATNGMGYVYGVLVEIALPVDYYVFAKSGSNIILAPTLTPDYTLNLYIINQNGNFIAGQRIKAVVTLRLPDGNIIQKPTIIMIKENS